MMNKIRSNWGLLVNKNKKKKYIIGVVYSYGRSIHKKEKKKRKKK